MPVARYDIETGISKLSSSIVYKGISIFGTPVAWFTDKLPYCSIVDCSGDFGIKSMVVLLIWLVNFVLMQSKTIQKHRKVVISVLIFKRLIGVFNLFYQKD